MRATSNTLFVRVNAGVTENAEWKPRDRKVTLENPNPNARINEFNVNKNI